MTYKERVRQLKEMDNIARNFDDENLIDIWLVEGCPDESTEEDYQYIAENEDGFNEVLKLFTFLQQQNAKE